MYPVDPSLVSVQMFQHRHIRIWIQSRLTLEELSKTPILNRRIADLVKEKTTEEQKGANLKTQVR